MNKKYIDLSYTITFHSYWHCGSGLAAGAAADELAIRDVDGLPYVPGRTVKGLLREAMEAYLHYTGGESDVVEELFGHFNGVDDMGMGCGFVGDAMLCDAEREAIKASRHLLPHLFHGVSSTAIDDDGIAVDQSLRRIEMVVPCCMYGVMARVPETAVSMLNQAVGLVKCMGLGRHRGYGRCTISIKPLYATES